MKLGWNELNESILYETIQTLLHQPRYNLFSFLPLNYCLKQLKLLNYFVTQSYRDNAIGMSKLMQDEIMPGREVAVYWIEHVLRHGGTKHLQNRAKHLPFYQRHLLDVLLLLSAVLAVSLFLNYKMLRWVMRKIKTSYAKSSRDEFNRSKKRKIN